MLTNWVSLVHKCRPLTVLAADSSIGFRVGGTPPVGVSPLVVDEHTRYFATIPLDDESGLELSIFTSLAEDSTDSAFLTKNMFTFHTEESHLAQFVTHQRANRVEASELKAGFSPHTLRLEAERIDYPNPEQNHLWTHHKIGGIPFFYHARPYIIDASDNLRKDKWIHLLQMTSLGYDDARVEGEWPFWDQMFHVFAKEEHGGLKFRYIWA